MVDWLTVLADPVDAVEHGVRQVREWETVMVGPRTYKRLDYPAAEILPQDAARTEGNEWTTTIFVNLYFSRDREYDLVEDVYHPVAGVIDECLVALGNEPAVVTYVPNRIESYAGELDNTGVFLVLIEFEVGVQADISTSG